MGSDKNGDEDDEDEDDDDDDDYIEDDGDGGSKTKKGGKEGKTLNCLLYIEKRRKEDGKEEMYLYCRFGVEKVDKMKRLEISIDKGKEKKRRYPSGFKKRRDKNKKMIINFPFPYK